MKTNFHKENFALSLAFIMRFKITRKWPVVTSLPGCRVVGGGGLDLCLATGVPLGD